MNRVRKAAGWPDKGLVEGYKKADNGEGKNIVDEFFFPFKDERKKYNGDREKEDSLKPAEFAGREIKDFTVVKADKSSNRRY